LGAQPRQKGEKALRYVLRSRIEGSERLTDCRLNGAETQGFITFVVFTAFYEVKPSLSHLDQRPAHSSIKLFLTVARHSAAMRLRSCNRSNDDIVLDS
jgi:hypothetical protein